MEQYTEQVTVLGGLFTAANAMISALGLDIVATVKDRKVWIGDLVYIEPEENTYMPGSGGSFLIYDKDGDQIERVSGNGVDVATAAWWGLHYYISDAVWESVEKALRDAGYWYLVKDD